jgi:hypothetical protein
MPCGSDGLWERPPGRDVPPKNRDEAVAPTGRRSHRRRLLLGID